MDFISGCFDLLVKNDIEEYCQKDDENNTNSFSHLIFKNSEKIMNQNFDENDHHGDISMLDSLIPSSK